MHHALDSPNVSKLPNFLLPKYFIMQVFNRLMVTIIQEEAMIILPDHSMLHLLLEKI